MVMGCNVGFCFNLKASNPEIEPIETVDQLSELFAQYKAKLLKIGGVHEIQIQQDGIASYEFPLFFGGRRLNVKLLNSPGMSGICADKHYLYMNIVNRAIKIAKPLLEDEQTLEEAFQNSKSKLLKA